MGGEAERLVDRLQQRHRHPAVGGELPVGAVQALGCLHPRRVQERQREGSPVDQGQDRLDREPRRHPRMQQPGAPDLRGSQSRFLTRQGAKLDQPPHEVLGDVRALGDLADPVLHQDAASSHPRLIVAQPGSPNRTPGCRSREQPRLAQWWQRGAVAHLSRPASRSEPSGSARTRPPGPQGQPILNAYAEFNALIEQSAYSPADKARMIQLPGLVGATD